MWVDEMIRLDRWKERGKERKALFGGEVLSCSIFGWLAGTDSPPTWDDEQQRVVRSEYIMRLESYIEAIGRGKKTTDFLLKDSFPSFLSVVFPVRVPNMTLTSIPFSLPLFASFSFFLVLLTFFCLSDQSKEEEHERIWASKSPLSSPKFCTPNSSNFSSPPSLGPNHHDFPRSSSNYLYSIRTRNQ